MGRSDNRHSMKMRRHVGANKKKARMQRKAEAVRQERRNKKSNSHAATSQG